ncbi:MAG: hypothetical protein PF517_00630 [Salinivirgaceae bacterium]|jgi:hypothetical protein|nr:hypothetical protein [Salinivirgaceae bacterium]
MRLIRIKQLSKNSYEDMGGNENSYLNGLLSAIETDQNVITFLHNTKTKESANNIIEKGFKFQSHLDYTTDVVSPKDPVTVKYFTIVRQAYGEFTIIMQISKSLIESYSELLEDISHHFSEILSINKPYLGPEDDLIYCLAPHFIKGYVEAEMGNFIQNPNFNPSLKIPIFDENLKKILNKTL